MRIEYINLSGIARAAATDTHVVQVSGASQVVVAGQVAMNEHGAIVGIRDVD